MSDTVEILEATLAGSEKAVRDRDQEIALLKTTMKGFEAALSLANDKAKELQSELDSIDRLSAPDDRELSTISRLVAAGQVIEERDRTIQDMKVLLQDARNMHALAQEQIGERDQSLNNIAFRLGFQHFSDDEVLTRINQLMEQTEEFSEGVLERDRAISNYKLELEDRDRKIEILKDNLDRARSEHLEQLRAISQYLEQLSNFPNITDKALGAIYLLTRVVYANIEKLVPNLKTTYDDL